MKSIKDLKLKLTTPKEKEVYERILLKPERIEGYKHLARLLEREDNLEQAEKVLRLGRSLFPKDRLLREQLAALYTTMGKSARAIDIYKQLIKEGESWSAYVRLARIYKYKGDLEKAVSVFKSVPSRSPFKERTYIPLYDLYFIIGDHKRGIRNLKEAIKRKGSSHQLIKKLGRLYMKDGKKEEAISWLKKALKHQPDDLDTIKLIGLANLDMKKYGLARRYFKKMLEQDKNSYQAHIELAELALRQNRLDEAKKWVDKIRRVQKKKGEPWDSRSKLALAEYYLKKDKPAKAVELAVDGLSETPNYYPHELVNAHSILAEAYGKMEDEFKAEVHGAVHQALLDGADPFDALTGLAEKLEKEKKLDQAKEVLEQLLVTFPGNTLTLLNLAEAQFSRGMADSAVELARAAAGGDAGRFVQDKIKALKLLVRLSKAQGQNAQARKYERQIKELEK